MARLLRLPSKACFRKSHVLPGNCRDRLLRPDARAGSARRSGRSVAPAIIWCDQRTDKQCAWITEKGRCQTSARTDLQSRAEQLYTDQTPVGPAARAGDLKGPRPRLLPKDYVRFRLSGAQHRRRRRLRHPDARRYARRWSDELLGLSISIESMLPKVYESPEVCAKISIAAPNPSPESPQARRSSRAQAIRRRARSAWASHGPAQ